MSKGKICFLSLICLIEEKGITVLYALLRCIERGNATIFQEYFSHEWTTNYQWYHLISTGWFSGKTFFATFLKNCMYIVRTYIHNSLVTLCTYIHDPSLTRFINTYEMRSCVNKLNLFFNFLYIWSYLWCINVLTCIFKRIVASSLYLAQNSHKLAFTCETEPISVVKCMSQIDWFLTKLTPSFSIYLFDLILIRADDQKITRRILMN